MTTERGDDVAQDESARPSVVLPLTRSIGLTTDEEPTSVPTPGHDLRGLVLGESEVIEVVGTSRQNGKKWRVLCLSCGADFFRYTKDIRFAQRNHKVLSCRICEDQVQSGRKAVAKDDRTRDRLGLWHECGSLYAPHYDEVEEIHLREAFDDWQDNIPDPGYAGFYSETLSGRSQKKRVPSLSAELKGHIRTAIHDAFIADRGPLSQSQACETALDSLRRNQRDVRYEDIAAEFRSMEDSGAVYCRTDGSRHRQWYSSKAAPQVIVTTATVKANVMQALNDAKRPMLLRDLEVAIEPWIETQQKGGANVNKARVRAVIDEMLDDGTLERQLGGVWFNPQPIPTRTVDQRPPYAPTPPSAPIRPVAELLDVLGRRSTLRARPSAPTIRDALVMVLEEALWVMGTKTMMVDALRRLDRTVKYVDGEIARQIEALRDEFVIMEVGPYMDRDGAFVRGWALRSRWTGKELLPVGESIPTAKTP